MSRPRAGRPNPLSGREVEVVALAAQGLSAKQIGERLYLSQDTVKSHLGRAFKKLGVQTRVAAVVRAMEQGIIPCACTRDPALLAAVEDAAKAREAEIIERNNRPS